MKFIKENWFKLAIIILLSSVIIIFFNRTDHDNNISNQDLILKCEEMYNIKHSDLESTRYHGQQKDALIWSKKTNSCLAYYNVAIEKPDSYQFEVWDYSNTDLVLSYKSYQSDKCIWNNIITSQQSLMYKLNSKLEGSGCDLALMDKGTDLLTNFETAMLDLGFKK